MAHPRDAARLAVALPPIVLGAVLALTSYRRWESNQRALRLGEPLPSGGPPRLLAAGIRAGGGGRALFAIAAAVWVHARRRVGAPDTPTTARPLALLAAATVTAALVAAVMAVVRP